MGNINSCVCCGDVIPEGTQLCWRCQRGTDNSYIKDLESLIIARHLCRLKELDYGTESKSDG